MHYYLLIIMGAIQSCHELAKSAFNLGNIYVIMPVHDSR